MLNSTQKRIVGAGVVLVAILLLVVPWNHTQNISGTHREWSAGYRPIFVPPEPAYEGKGGHGVRINTTQMVLPIGAVILAAWAGVVLAREKKL